MNHLERNIVSSIACYPIAYYTRFDVLDHLFCTLGGGYEWIDGRLEDIYNIYGIDLNGTEEEFEESLRLAIKEINKKTVKRLKLFKESEMYSILPKEISEKHILEHYSSITLDLEISISKSKIISTYPASRVYPISRGYSAIHTIPDDAKPEYIEGARESIQMVLSATVKDGIWDRKVTIAEHAERNIKIVLECLERINERWGS